jgi:two-component system response regulator AtoC
LNLGLTALDHVLEGVFMRKFQPLLRQISGCEAPILIQGETGVGKEVIATLVHAQSPRADKPFLKLNCAALPSELVESELFGYEKGAFTGAFKSKPGKFDLADTGTLLLDEIGDMDFKLQAKLLQVVQDQRFERLGGEETVSVNVRVMAATHCDLEKAIEDRRFREDLYYRLNVITIVVPALRERTDEIIPLTRFFIRKHSAPGVPLPDINSALQRELLAYEWPGNVRELENSIRKFCVFRNPEMVIDDLQRRAMKRGSLRTSVSARAIAANSNVGQSLEKISLAQKQIETETIVSALRSTHWNRKRAAALLQVDYKILLYRMKKLGIDEGGSSAQESISAADADKGAELTPPFSLAAQHDKGVRIAAGD